MSPIRIAAALLALLCGGAPTAAQDLRGVGVVLIHGKGGGQGPLQPLAQALRQRGAIILMPGMSWRSGYQPYENDVAAVAAAVRRVKQAGARKVFLAGHSMGANISIGYSASGGQADGIIALAPGHRPDYIATITGDSLQRARAMVAAGQGGQRAQFFDFNGRGPVPITTTAAAYVSWFDPDGPSGQAARGRGIGAPILWVVGRNDRPAMRDQATYRGSRIEVEANHQQTPVVAVPQVIEWIASN